MELSSNKKVKVNTIEFLMGAKVNLNDTMAKAKIQYTEDGKTWVDLSDEIYTSPQEIRVDNLDLEVQGIRLIATEAKENTWLGVRDISVNKTASKDEINPTVIKTPEWSIYNNGNEANLIDGNDNSSIWYVTHKPGDITRVGDYVGVDLGKVINVGKVHLAVGAGDGDKWTKYKLEYSSDNTNWTTFKEYEGTASGKDVIDEDFEGIEARYIRITNMKEEHKWVKFSEIKVEPCKSLPSTDHIYTNTNNDIKSVYESDALTKLVAKENITLNEGEYIGIKLDRIKDLKGIDLDVSNMEGLTLQTSLNGMEWSNVTNKSTLEDARYIRIIADKTITFDLNKLEVTSNEVYEPSLVSAYAGTYGDNAAKLAFDGNLNTYAQFNAVPRKGNTIVYDLGQTIDVNNLKYLVLDTEKDHIRDAKIQLSLDGKEWTDAIVIGDGKKDEGGADAKPQDNGYTHGSLSNGKVPISHAYMDSGKINVSARYLRVEFTADYDHRWTVINEFLINDGEYIPTVNDPTFISDPIEIKGFSPLNIMDGDLTTFYKPNTKDGEIKSGSLTYRLSENTDVKKINIVQSGSSISNAKVMARTGYNEDGEPIWNQIGELNKSLNEIVNTKYDNIFEIKIEWEGTAPTIYELITLNDYEVPNISELEELIASSNYAKDDYTANSWNVYNEALESAKNIIENIDGTSQEDINNAKENLINAITGLVNISELNKVIANANDIINGGVQYTEETLNVLKEAIANGTKVLENDAATTEEVKAAVESIEKSIDGLIEEESNLSNKHLQIAVEEALKITDEELSNIAPAVVEEFKAALEEAQAILANKEATQEEVNKSFDRLSKVMQMLSFEKGNKEYLIQLVERINSLNSNDYIVSTWDKLQEVLVKANNVIADQNAMEEEVSKTYDELLRAFLELRLKPSKDKLQDLINKAESLDSSKYTKESWSVLERKLKVAKDVLADENSTEKEISEAAKGLEDAIDGLIIADAGNNNSNNGESNSGSSNNNNSGNGNSLPKTGGVSSVAMSLLGLVTVGIGSFLRRKNK